jgi:hypothetical protein
MSTLQDLRGKRFGRLMVIRRSSSHARGKLVHSYWVTRCQCGKVKEVRGSHLRSGNVRSCGCLTIEVMKARSTHHGEYDGTRWSPEYLAWRSIKGRCLNPRHSAYKDYGGRGITLSREWVDDPMAFIRHVGRRPSTTHSIERIKNNGNYEPGNVRWATDKEQQRNTRSNVLVTVRGVTLCLRAWAEKNRWKNLDLPSSRINRGWDPQRAVTVPPLR